MMPRLHCVCQMNIHQAEENAFGQMKIHQTEENAFVQMNIRQAEENAFGQMSTLLVFCMGIAHFYGFLDIATRVTSLGRHFFASSIIPYVGAMLRSSLIVHGGSRRRPNPPL